VAERLAQLRLDLTPDSPDRLAIRATNHCLTGCVAGEVAGMALATAFGWGNAATIAAAVLLAFVFGYALTSVPLLRSGLPFGAAMRTALAGDTVSIAIMEAIDNLVVVLVPGALAAGLGDALFWWPIALGFAVAWPFAFLAQRALIRRGRGHAHHH
jgi:uncharacterized protein DUF4396